MAIIQSNLGGKEGHVKLLLLLKCRILNIDITLYLMSCCLSCTVYHYTSGLQNFGSWVSKQLLAFEKYWKVPEK